LDSAVHIAGEGATASDLIAAMSNTCTACPY
jgi:hypothetical protein